MRSPISCWDWVLARLAEHGLVRDERIGIDASTMEADAALRTIVRRDSGETYRQMLHRMAEASGIATPTADDLVRLDRECKDFRAVGMTGRGRRPWHVTTQSTDDPGRALGPAAGRA